MIIQLVGCSDEMFDSFTNRKSDSTMDENLYRDHWNNKLNGRRE